FHLAALVKADRAHQAIADAGPAKRLLERPRLRIRAIEHRHLGEGPVAGAGPATQLRDDPLGFVPLVSSCEQSDLLAALPPGAQGLARPPLVLCDHAMGGVEYDLGRAVVLLQPNEPSPGKVTLEVEHVPDVGAAPAVDGLIVIAHRAHVAVGAKPSHEEILRL